MLGKTGLTTTESTNQLMYSTRLHSMDALRGCLMLLGILVHIALCHALFWGKFWILQDSYQNIIFDVFILIIRSFRMELFFFMSGFFVNLMLETKGHYYFIKNRIVKILIPFIVCEQIMLIIMPLAVPQQVLNNDINYFRPFHLWFLYYLMLIYINIYVFKIIIKIFFWQQNKQQKLKKTIEVIFTKLMASKAHILILASITFLSLTAMQSIVIDTPIGFSIQYRLLIHYGIFFYFGWMTRQNPKVFTSIINNRTIYLLIAIANIIFLTISFLKFNINYSHSNNIIFLLHFLIFRGSYACCTWCLVFGMIGFFQYYLNKENKLLRYLSASSYWLYIIHLPIICFLEKNNLYNNIALGCFKPIIIFFVSLFVLLISYHAIIRYNYLKYFLNS